MESLRVGILGTGSMAGVMARAIAKMKNTEAVAVGSRSLEKAESFAKEYGIPAAYGSYEELYEDETVDIIYVVTPHSHHARYAGECIEHGKPCIVEKSFTANAREAEELIRKAENAGVFITEAIWTRYMPMVQMIREAVFSGKIGRICSVTANLGYAVSQRERVIEPSLCGGALLDVGIYALTFISMILGDEFSELKASAVLSDKGTDLDNHVTMTVRHEGTPVLCSFYSSIDCPTDRNGVIYGTDGYIVVGNVNNFEFLEIYDSAHRLTERIEAPSQPGTGYEYQFEACRKALAEGALECPEMTHQETVRIMEIMDQMRREMGVVYPNDRKI